MNALKHDHACANEKELLTQAMNLQEFYFPTFSTTSQKISLPFHYDDDIQFFLKLPDLIIFKKTIISPHLFYYKRLQNPKRKKT